MSFKVQIETEVEIEDLPEEMFDDIIQMLLNEMFISMWRDEIYLWIEPNHTKDIKIVDLAKGFVQSSRNGKTQQECLKEVAETKHALEQAIKILDEFADYLPDQTNAKAPQ